MREVLCVVFIAALQLLPFCVFGADDPDVGGPAFLPECCVVLRDKCLVTVEIVERLLTLPATTERPMVQIGKNIPVFRLAAMDSSTKGLLLGPPIVGSRDRSNGMPMDIFGDAIHLAPSSSDDPARPDVDLHRISIREVMSAVGQNRPLPAKGATQALVSVDEADNVRLCIVDRSAESWHIYPVEITYQSAPLRKSPTVYYDVVALSERESECFVMEDGAVSGWTLNQSKPSVDWRKVHAFASPKHEKFRIRLHDGLLYIFFLETGGVYKIDPDDAESEKPPAPEKMSDAKAELIIQDKDDERLFFLAQGRVYEIRKRIVSIPWELKIVGEPERTGVANLKALVKAAKEKMPEE